MLLPFCFLVIFSLSAATYVKPSEEKFLEQWHGSNATGPKYCPHFEGFVTSRPEVVPIRKCPKEPTPSKMCHARVNHVPGKGLWLWMGCSAYSLCNCKSSHFAEGEFGLPNRQIFSGIECCCTADMCDSMEELPQFVWQLGAAYEKGDYSHETFSVPAKSATSLATYVVATFIIAMLLF